MYGKLVHMLNPLKVLKITTFWDVTPYILLEIYQHSEGTCSNSLLLQCYLILISSSVYMLINKTHPLVTERPQNGTRQHSLGDKSKYWQNLAMNFEHLRDKLQLFRHCE